MENYEINNDTLAILPTKKGKTKIVERDKTYYCDEEPYKVMDENCKYYGSSYLGRLEAAKKILECSYKLPILVEETQKLIFFPTKSSLVKDCSWINVNTIKRIESEGKNTRIIFDNGKDIVVPSSKLSLQNQIYRSNKLENILNRRIYSKK